MDGVKMLEAENRKMDRLNEAENQLRNEYHHKLDVLNEIYSVAFPDYSTKGKPLCSMPFVGDPGNDQALERQLIEEIKRKFEEE